MTQLETAVKRVGSKRRYEKKKAVLQSGEMNQIKVSYTAGGSQALASSAHSSVCWRPSCGNRSIWIWSRIS